MTETKMVEVYEETMSLEDGFAGRVLIRRHENALGYHTVTAEVYRTMRLHPEPLMIVWSTQAARDLESAERKLPEARRWIKTATSGLRLLVNDATASVVQAVVA